MRFDHSVVTRHDTDGSRAAEQEEEPPFMEH